VPEWMNDLKKIFLNFQN